MLIPSALRSDRFGCGKSTALRIVGGLIPASAGRIMVAGRDVSAMPSYARNMGLVFQNYALFPYISVAGNVAFGLEMRGVKRREALRRAQRCAVSAARRTPGYGAGPAAAGGRRLLRQYRDDQPGCVYAAGAAGYAAPGAALADRSAWSAGDPAEAGGAGAALADALDHGRARAACAGG
ncbi:ATP-binding cassette domain-containing protein [Rhodovastum sp. RN2-1]|uniref:ATP-binding cassette domain-containing protein n=1 Tax=Limobrevibacterium gyesilva TaxID=2991712 RepID=A0AA42CHC4_9PROT|nr:ATP-binding cassette domain-containing protein [Limobrevibacterium gyesilva]